MKRIILSISFSFVFQLFALDTDSLHVFWKNVDPVNIVLTSLSSDRIGQFFPERNEIDIDEYTATSTTLIHEYMHHMIFKHRIDLSREDQEYVCCLVEAIYEFTYNGVEEKRYINSYTHKSMYFTKRMMSEYISWLKSKNLID